MVDNSFETIIFVLWSDPNHLKSKAIGRWSENFRLPSSTRVYLRALPPSVVAGMKYFLWIDGKNHGPHYLARIMRW